MRRAVKIITIEITTSVAESIPSPTTAKLPAHKPILIFYIFCQKQIIGGIANGAVKG